MSDEKQTQRNSTLDAVARILTYLFSPPTATFVSILITHKKYISTGGEPAWDWLISGFLLLIATLTTLWIFVKSKLVSNWDITDRKQRPKFLAVVTVYTLILFLVTWKLGYREALPILSLFVSALFISTVITLFWKISFHTFSVTLSVLLVISAYVYTSKLSYGLLILPFIIAWTRIHLGKHTLNQALGGILLGIAMLWVWLVLPVELLI